MTNRIPKTKRTVARTSALKPAPQKPEPAKIELAAPAAPVKAEPAPVLPRTQQPTKVEAPKLTQPVLPKAHLELVKPEAKHVFVAGSFNGWDPSTTPLTRVSDGKWVGDLSGISGRHEYLFVVDGQWLPDPNATESVQNPFGGRNSVLVVSE